MPTNHSFAAHLEAAERERFTGSLTLGKPPGKVFFLVGRLMHATATMPGASDLTGLDAIREIARRCPKTVPAEKSTERMPQGVNLTGTTMAEVIAAIREAQQQAAPTRAFIEALPSLPVAPPLPPLPLLPVGTALFQKMPIAQVNFDLLLGTLPNSMITVESPNAVGVALIKDGALDTAFHHNGRQITWDEEALADIRAMDDATASVYILPADVIETIPAIVATPVAYEALQLEWLNWPRLVAELSRRGGLGVIEIQTTAGSGVLILREGNKPIVYTDAHPAPGEISLLDPLIAAGVGSLRVRHSQVAAPAPASTPAPPALPSPAEYIADAQARGGAALTGAPPPPSPAPPLRRVLMDAELEAALPTPPLELPPAPAPPPTPEPTPETTPASVAAPEVVEAPFPLDEIGDDIDIELTPAGPTSTTWDESLQFDTNPPETTAPPPAEPAPAPTSVPTPETNHNFPDQALAAAVKSALGPRAARLQPILDQAKAQNLSPADLAAAVRAFPFPAFSEDKVDNLATTLEEILSTAAEQ